MSEDSETEKSAAKKAANSRPQGRKNTTKRARKAGKKPIEESFEAVKEEKLIPLINESEQAPEIASEKPNGEPEHEKENKRPRNNNRRNREPREQDDKNPRRERPTLDGKAVAKKAWKIYLSEVSEEGVALINDKNAKELSRRCFRLAELFMEEEAYRLSRD